MSPFKIHSMNRLKEWYWFMFVDDTFVIQQQAHKQSFLDHINSIDPTIKFTVEGNQENGSIPFLDTFPVNYSLPKAQSY